MHSKLNVGIIGAGRIGKVHAETIAFRLPEATTLAITDINRKAAEDVAHKPDRKAAVSRAKRRRVVAWGYRARGSGANAVGQFDSQYLKQDTAFSQANFQTASRTSQLGLAQRHRSKDDSRPPEDATAVAGGPFVSPPGR